MLGDFSLQKFMLFLVKGAYWVMQDTAVLWDTYDPETQEELKQNLPFLSHELWPEYRNLVLAAHNKEPDFVPLPPDVSAEARLLQQEGEMARLRTDVNRLKQLLEEKQVRNLV